MTGIEATFIDRTPASAAHAARAAAVMPGGDTRAAAHHPPYQLTMTSGVGPYLTDLDGHRYLDLIGNFTSLVHGNAFGPIIEAATAAAARGTNWPARNEAAVELAEELCRRVASVDQVRFTNSGSEATMLAVEIARVATGRRRFLMAKYGYHGSMPQFEIGTSGQSGGETLIAPFGDLTAFEEMLELHGDDIACVILEPVLGSGGVVTPPDGFLAGVAAAARRVGALFVLDEVITLRLAPGGHQAVEGLLPDLTAMAKIIGGGFPVGAIGGRADLMELCNPFRPRIFHSGTFNGNPVTMAAGLEAVRHLTSDSISTMAVRSASLEERLRTSASTRGVPFSTRRAGSLLQVYLSDELPASNGERGDGELANLLHLALLNQGVFCAARGLIALSTALDDGLIEDAAARFDAALADVAAS
ncbi:MAG: aminotransferase class III-fold pyridoxal phosphate-dependent enzyme [Acidimicrobiia bacterium]|nr:aminotransferase class III-fold pyridoxal phosphate-dependent enzyme [Acidimicrobiia bacterium]